jgi:hypothetical protein
MGYHARLSPSSSAQWTACAVAPRRQQGFADTSNDAADQGTVAHDLGEQCLKAGDDVWLDIYRGKLATVDANGDVTYWSTEQPHLPQTHHLIDDEMIAGVKVYTDFVRGLLKGGGELFVEQRVSIEHITGEKGARGTSDTVILFPEEICIVDLKFGMVQVDASEPNTTLNEAFASAPPDAQVLHLFPGMEQRKPNTQLVMYADGALREHELFHDFKRVRIIIVQPRLDHIDEYVMPIEEHRAWVQWIRERADETRNPDAVATPGAKQCKYCAVSGDPSRCPEQALAALNEAFGDFTDLDAAEVRQVPTLDLSAVYAKIEFLRGFCKAVEGRVLDELNTGHPVAGYKLVVGKEGNRKWVSEDKAVELLKSFRMKDDEMYDRSVISPTTAEKKLKKEQPKRWAKCEALIVRAPGAPTVVPESDPRPARVVNHADDFDDDTNEAADGGLSDFF